MINEFVIYVPGKPEPQGSMKGYVVRSKTGALHAAVTHGKSTELNAWRNLIALAAATTMAHERLKMLDEPLELHLHFVLAKPKSARKRDIWPAKRPDLDKLLRSTLDALTGVVFSDDARVVKLRAEKDYDVTMGCRIGVEIRIIMISRR